MPARKACEATLSGSMCPPYERGARRLRTSCETSGALPRAPVALLFLLEELHYVLQELPGDVRVLLGKLPEIPKAHGEAAHGPVRGHRRGADALADQGELAEVVARPQLSDLVAVEAHRRRAVDDDEEGDPA